MFQFKDLMRACGHKEDYKSNYAHEGKAREFGEREMCSKCRREEYSKLKQQQDFLIDKAKAILSSKGIDISNASFMAQIEPPSVEVILHLNIKDE